MNNFVQRVYGAVEKIPRGRVTTYKDIAKAIGSPRVARAVGNALNKNNSLEIPCHRVVRSDGRVGGYNKGSRAKVKILLNEGVKINNGHLLNLTIFRWNQKKFLK